MIEHTSEELLKNFFNVEDCEEKVKVRTGGYLETELEISNETHKIALKSQ